MTWRIIGITELVSDSGKHAWQVSPYWDSASGQWLAQIEPGFIAGKDATISIPVNIAPSATLARLKFQGASAGDNVTAFLTERPAWPLTNFRAIGTDADANPTGVDDNGNLTFAAEPVPAFFAAMGVIPATQVQLDGDTLVTQQSGVIGSNANAPLLRACDIAVYVDHPATASNVTQNPDGTTDYSTIVQQPTNPASHPYLQQSPKFSGVTLQDSSALLEGNLVDPTYDSWLVATVYLLSPANAGYGSAPDGSWSAYVAHSRFWNMNYALNQSSGNLVTQTLTLDTGLAGGVGDATNDELLSAQNDAASAAAAFLNANRIQSLAWSV